MAYADHDVILFNSGGTQTSRLREWSSLEYAVRLNKPGDCTVVAHKDANGASDLAVDNRVEIKRRGVSVFKGKFDWENPQYDDAGDPTAYQHIRGADYNRLPTRNVLRNVGSAVTGNPDDVMKHFARYAWGGSAEAGRKLPGFSVEANAAQCPGTYHISGEPQETAMDVIKRVGEAAGVDWWVNYAGGSYTFHTGYPRRGADRSSSIVFTVNRKNVTSFAYERDVVDRVNYVYVGGPGRGASQTIGSYFQGAEPTGWDRWETFVRATDAEYADELAVYGSAYLETFGSGVESVTFGVHEIGGYEWPTDYDLGDLVTVYDPKFNKTVVAKIEEVGGKVDAQGKEELKVTVGRPRPTEWEKLQGKIGPYSKFGDDSAPATPTGLGYTTSTYEDDQGNQFASVQLTWSANTELDLARYVAEWSRDNTDWQSTQVDSSATSCRVDGLALGASYYFRVKAVDTASNESSYANFNSGSAVTMPSDTTGPDAPGSLVTYSRYRAVHLEWENPSQKDFDYTEVWRSAGSLGPGTNIADVKANSYTDQIGLWDSSFYYDVRAVDRVGNAGSYWSDAYNAGVWTLGTTDTVSPAPPTALTAGTGTHVDADGHIIPWIKATWDRSATEDVQGYELEYAYKPLGTWWDPQTARTSGTAGTVYRISPAVGSADFRMRVRSVDDANLTSEWYPSGTYVSGFVPKDNTAPQTPTNLAVEAALKAIRISVDEPGDADWAGCAYHVSDSDGFTPAPGNLVHAGKTTSHLHKTDDFNTKYVRVRAYDTSGNYSSYTAQGDATPSQLADGDVPAGEIGATKILIDAGVDLSDWHYGGGSIDGGMIQPSSILMTRIDGDLDDVGDGTTYARVLATYLDAGKITLIDAEGDLDDISDGGTYAKILATDISAGHIKLTSNTVVDGEWYDESGVEIDASSGINIYGTDNALTTRATKTGTVQCSVNSSGQITAGAGVLQLDADGLTINTATLTTANKIKLTISGSTGAEIYAYYADSGLAGNQFIVSYAAGTTKTVMMADYTIINNDPSPKPVYVAGGLAVGWESYSPATLPTNTPGTQDVHIRNDIRVGGDVYIGGTGTNPGYPLHVIGRIYASDYIIAMGGIHVGGTSDPGTDRLLVDDYAAILGGVWVGRNSDPGADNLRVDGVITVDGEIRQGGSDYGAYEIQTSGQLYVNDYIMAMGGIHVGGTSDPGTDDLVVDGDVAIGVSSANYPLDVRGNDGNYIVFAFNDGNAGSRHVYDARGGQDTNPSNNFYGCHDGNGTLVGTIKGDGAGGIELWSASDRRIKSILGTLGETEAVLALRNVQSIMYRGKGAENGSANVGFVAQALEPWTEGVVSYDEEEDLYGLSYDKLTPYLWTGWQYHDAIIEKLKRRIERLETQLNA